MECNSICESLMLLIKIFLILTTLFVSSLLFIVIFIQFHSKIVPLLLLVYRTLSWFNVLFVKILLTLRYAPSMTRVSIFKFLRQFECSFWLIFSLLLTAIIEEYIWLSFWGEREFLGYMISVVVVLSCDWKFGTLIFWSEMLIRGIAHQLVLLWASRWSGALAYVVTTNTWCKREVWIKVWYLNIRSPSGLIR